MATGYDKPSANQKTGSMIQTWILRSDEHPVVASPRGLDASICGDCTHRGDPATGRKRTCYVQLDRAPGQIYRSYKAGGYARGVLPTTRPVRIGAYGDPAAVPFEVWEPALEAGKRTGYTHRWRVCDQRLKQLCQASCDSHGEMIEAAMAGWHTFLVEPAHADVVFRPPTVAGKALIQCLNTTNAIQCADCGVCDGNKAHVWIAAHGAAGAYV